MQTCFFEYVAKKSNKQVLFRVIYFGVFSSQTLSLRGVFETRRQVMYNSILGNLKCRDVAQPGSAFAWGAKGREFKSRHPDQLNKKAFLSESLFVFENFLEFFF